jgi:two-component system, NarL family, response regulator NreC
MDTKDRFTRILVADDNELMRRGIFSLLREHARWIVCGEAKDGLDAVEKALLLKPDIILMDLSMPDLNGFEVARRIHEQLPGCRIVMVTEHDPRTFSHITPQPGVRGYVMKSGMSVDLVAAIEVTADREPLPTSA